MKLNRSEEQQAAAERGEVDVDLCRSIRTDDQTLHALVEAVMEDLRRFGGRSQEQVNRYVLQSTYTLLMAVGQGARRLGFPLPEVLALVEAGWTTDEGVH